MRWLQGTFGIRFNAFDGNGVMFFRLDTKVW